MPGAGGGGGGAERAAFLIPLLLSDVAHSSIHRVSFCPIDSGRLTLSLSLFRPPSPSLKAVIDRQMMPPPNANANLRRVWIFRQKFSNVVWRMAAASATADKMRRPNNLCSGRVNKIVDKPVVSVSTTLI